MIAICALISSYVAHIHGLSDHMSIFVITAHWVSKLRIELLQLAHKYYVTTNKCIVNYVINIQQQVLTRKGVFKTN